MNGKDLDEQRNLTAGCYAAFDGTVEDREREKP
jgi:hypothetical protein